MVAKSARGLTPAHLYTCGKNNPALKCAVGCTCLMPLAISRPHAARSYIYSLYMSVTAFAGLGDGDFYTANPSENVAMSLYLLFNVVLGAYILASVPHVLELKHVSLTACHFLTCITYVVLSLA